jgi:3-methyladenine DNA glycosylase/8-oxoguanine DNA glycosylase
VTRPTSAQLAALARRDPSLGAAMKRLPRFPGFPDAGQRRFPSHYAYLARVICFQQLAFKAADTIHRRVCALTSGASFPRPPELLALPDAKLRGAGLSRNKLAALRDLARHVDDGRLPLSRIARLSDEAVIEHLVQVRGIGRWSAEMFLLFRLGRLDVFSAGDLGVCEGLRLLDGRRERPTPKEALARAEVWRPLRSVGTWLMYRVVEEQRA